MARSFKFQTANDPSKSDQARAAASDQEADGKQSAKLLRNISLICTSLVHEGETSNGMEKRHYLHLWTRLTRCMAGEFYTKNLYKIHCDELVAACIGELHHKLTLYCGFSFPPNSLGYDRLQPFLMLKHRGKALVDPINKLALGPKILGSVESSEAMHQLVSKGIEKWTRRDQHAISATVDMLKDLHIAVPGCKEDVDPRTSFNLGNALQNGETVVECLARLDFEVNHFFFSLSTRIVRLQK